MWRVKRQVLFIIIISSLGKWDTRGQVTGHDFGIVNLGREHTLPEPLPFPLATGLRDRASAGSSACRPTHRLQLFPPLTTAVGEKWGSVLVIITWSWKWGGLTHEQDLIISLYIPFFWLWSSQEWESIIWVHEKAPVPRLSINPIYNIANAFEVCMSGAI